MPNAVAVIMQTVHTTALKVPSSLSRMLTLSHAQPGAVRRGPSNGPNNANFFQRYSWFSLRRSERKVIASVGAKGARAFRAAKRPLVRASRTGEQELQARVAAREFKH